MRHPTLPLSKKNAAHSPSLPQKTEPLLLSPSDKTQPFLSLSLRGNTVAPSSPFLPPKKPAAALSLSPPNTPAPSAALSPSPTNSTVPLSPSPSNRHRPPRPSSSNSTVSVSTKHSSRRRPPRPSKQQTPLLISPSKQPPPPPSHLGLAAPATAPLSPSFSRTNRATPTLPLRLPENTAPLSPS